MPSKPSTKKRAHQKHLDYIKASIRTVPHFPKKGIMFRDVTTLLKDHKALKNVIDLLIEKYKKEKIDLIAGIESRGFIFAGIMASKMRKGLVLIRKPGKLPAEIISQEYELEYGTNKIEIHKDAIRKGDRVLLIDDLYATGGTMLAACKLVEKLGGKVAGCAFVMEQVLPEGKARKKLKKYPVFRLVEFDLE